MNVNNWWEYPPLTEEEKEYISSRRWIWQYRRHDPQHNLLTLAIRIAKRREEEKERENSNTKK